MSLFRKPKKIQRRVFCADDDEDGEPEAPPPPVISQEREKKEAKSVKSTPLLSFADEEEDGEVFKVKKSSQSKRLAKKREKEKQKRDVRTDGDNNKYDNNILEEKNNHTDGTNDKPKTKKKVTLEGLILAGREALAADGAGDVSDDSAAGEEEEDEDNRGFHRYRAESVRAALMGAPGRIPDAALIHAARKTRQQARELGGDYVPLKSEAAPGSRLVRDDGSGDDEEEGRIHVRGLDLPSDKPKRGTAAASEEELDSEAEEWEEQQLQKARPALVDLTGEGAVEMNPFSVALPAPQQSAPEHLRPLTTNDTQPPTSANDLVDALKKRLQELRVERDATSTTQKELRDRLLTSARIRESRAARCGELDAAYKRAQAIRGFLTDLIECLDEKMPQLEALEARALALHKRRCEFLIERRRADLRDQAQDVLTTPGRAANLKPSENEEKTRRAAEREGRRRARRLKREAAAAAAGAALPHRDGDSSDDELPPQELHHYTTERDSIRAASAQLFSDALPAWRSVSGVCGRLAGWRARAPDLYSDAYVAACLPRLLAPYVRHELILWNPLADEDNEDYEKMDWYKCLMMYGVRWERPADSSESASDDEVEPPPVTETAVRDDPDLMLVPAIVSRVVLPKLTELVTYAWDPLVVRACVRLRGALLRAAATPQCRAPLRRLSTAIRARLSAALGADVFLPALPPHVLEGAGGAFWRRCLGAGVRLLRATLALAGPPAPLYADPLVLSLIDTLCCGAGAAGGPYIAAAAVALCDTLPRDAALRARALARLAALATLALSRLDTDNPLHLKALEQARAVIAEARAVE
ncbi:PAX3- and PAX7-binding protein 1 [Helicoverpa zea]|uniref:PAX3- and PAX7-binding protein 1 n=1 Tax=Helicoverpa zea TaxID=7113 RepID=UPI001F5A105C|nr:PAX3- and PAX7-binding protein 1 [Helicoverpa zea]